MPDDEFASINESQLPTRVATRTAEQELLAAGYEQQGSGGSCSRCGRPIRVYRGASNIPVVVSAETGTLHASCGGDREPVPEPLPPVPTFADQQRKLEELLRGQK